MQLELLNLFFVLHAGILNSHLKKKKKIECLKTKNIQGETSLHFTGFWPSPNNENGWGCDALGFLDSQTH